MKGRRSSWKETPVVLCGLLLVIAGSPVTAEAQPSLTEPEPGEDEAQASAAAEQEEDGGTITAGFKKGRGNELFFASDDGKFEWHQRAVARRNTIGGGRRLGEAGCSLCASGA